MVSPAKSRTSSHPDAMRTLQALGKCVMNAGDGSLPSDRHARIAVAVLGEAQSDVIFDHSELIRSVLDAITHILIVDDSQVVDIFAVKLYATPSVGPGVKVKLEEVNPLVRLDIPPILGIP